MGGCREKTKNMRLREKKEEGLTSRLKWRAEMGKFTSKSNLDQALNHPFFQTISP
jgi:hypothetical protein